MRIEQWLAEPELYLVEELQNAGGVGRGNPRIESETCIRWSAERHSTYVRDSNPEKAEYKLGLWWDTEKR